MASDQAFLETTKIRKTIISEHIPFRTQRELWISLPVGEMLHGLLAILSASSLGRIYLWVRKQVRHLPSEPYG